MKKEDIKTIISLAIGIGGPIVAYKLHKAAKRLDAETDRIMKEIDELDKAMSKEEAALHESFAETIECSRRAEKIIELIENRDDMFDEQLRETMLDVEYDAIV
jgi:anion-transporting  ArsA/GET3 family ATPase